jgi:hypothetical protein
MLLSPAMPEATRPSRIALLLRIGLAPLAIYLLTFVVLTFPAVLKLGTHLLGDEGDALANLWGIWWVGESLAERHRLPLHTDYLHYPHGITMLPQVIGLPFNGLLVLPLRPWLTLEQSYNAVVLFSFAVGGLTAFWLAHRFTRAWGASLAAGALFTFANYHFAHAQQHLNLVSLEWVPLFLLLAFRALERPSAGRGIAAGAALALVTLCDFYYAFYCSLAAAIVLAWSLARRTLRREHLKALAGFAAVASVTIVPLFGSIAWLSRHDPLLGSHVANEYSLDLLAPFVPGGHWRFHRWTAGYWSRLPGNIDESSVHIGLSVLCLAGYAVWRRRDLGAEGAVGMWALLGLAFAILGLGPALQVAGRQVTGEWLPYAWITRAVPAFALSGMPVRMIVITQLAVAILAAWALPSLWKTARGRGLACVLLGLAIFEYLPTPIPTTRLETPAYVAFLASVREPAAVLDGYSSFSHALLWQTRHGKKLGFGYVSRVPASVAERDALVSQAAWDGDWVAVRDRYGFTHVVVPVEGEAPAGVPSLLLPPEVAREGPGKRVVFDDGRVRVIELEPKGSPPKR